MKEHESLWSRFAQKMYDWGSALTMSMAAISGLTITGRRAVQSYADMEGEMANVRKFTGMTTEEVERLNESITTLATRSSREQLNKLAQEDGKLVIVVCDGRNKRGSAGMTLPELADKMISLGCVEAINLDGGGSSTFVGREGMVLNLPSYTEGTDPAGAAIVERRIPTAVVIAAEE